MSPRLDFRDADAFYAQTLELARAWCPDWSASWPSDALLSTRDDVGLALFRLFSDLGQYVVRQLNGVPDKNELAFFNFLGLNPRLPQAASAALVFSLVSQDSTCLVPAGTTIASALDREVLFLTASDLTVLPAIIELALLVDPDQDGYVDDTDRVSSETPFPLFTAAEQPMPHLMLLGSATLFEPGPALQQMQIQLLGSDLMSQYFGKWFDGDGNPLRVTLTENADNSQLQILFIDMPKAPAKSVLDAIDAIVGVVQGITDEPQLFPAGVSVPEGDQYWLGVTPIAGVKILPIDHGNLPKITGVVCQLSGSGIQPSAAATNNSLLAIKDGNYPFGPKPKLDDCFYLRSDSLFGKVGAFVSCNFDLRTVEPPPNQSVTAVLAWEFWDGSSWVGFNSSKNAIQLYHFIDTTSNLTHNNEKGPTLISFICPSIQPTKVAGVTGYWIRARIASGDYGSAYMAKSVPIAKAVLNVADELLVAFIQSKTGKALNALEITQLKGIITSDLGIKQGLNFSSKIEEGGYYPPFILSLYLSYNFAGPPDSYVTYNDFTPANMVLQPYTPAQERYTTFYLGFAVAGFSTLAPGERLTIFFALNQPSSSASPSGRYFWEYNNGKLWLPLKIKDGTDGFSKPGIVSFVVPEDLQPAILFSRELCWFRILDLMPGDAQGPVVSGIYPNAVNAANAVPVSNEILGSSLGIPNQSVRFALPYVLANQVLVVAETIDLDSSNEAIPDEPPKLSQTTEEARANLTRRPEIANVEVVWEEVENFANSDPKSRHYTLEHSTGLVTFGDGVNGMVPPRGKNNIIARSYDSSKGMRGDQPANSISVQTPPLAQIAAVWNPVQAIGGSEGDTNQLILARGPELIAAYMQGLTLRDLSYLALEASPLLLRASATVETLGPVRVALLCDLPGQAPEPDADTLAEVVAYLKPRVLATLAPRLVACAPDYLAIEIDGNLIADQPAALVLRRVQAKLSGFLDPKSGGLAGEGWDFGARIHVSELSRQVATVEGVVSVHSLLANGSSKTLLLGSSQLPTPGSIQFVIYDEEGVNLGD